MPSFRLPDEHIRRITRMFTRYRKIRSLISRNVDEYISDFTSFTGTPQERDEYLERKYRQKAPQESCLAILSGNHVRFYVRDIAILTGRDASSTSRLLANLERSECWYSRLVSLRHETKSANNNTIYFYDREIFGLIMDYREHMYLERIRRAGAVDFGEVLRLWEYLKMSADYEDGQSVSNFNAVEGGHDDAESAVQKLPDIPPVSWHDVLRIIGTKLFSVKADMIFALTFAVTFIVAKRFTVMIPVFAAMSAIILLVCVMKLRHRSAHTEILAEAGAVMALLAAFWGVNLTMDNGIYTPGGTVMNLTTPEPGLSIRASRGEYMGFRDKPLVFFVDADNEAEITQLFYRADSGDWRSTGRAGTGNVDFRLRPRITGGKITLEVKYVDSGDKEHGPYSFTFDVAEERFKSGKNAVINHPDILWLMPQGNMTVINSFMNSCSTITARCPR